MPEKRDDNITPESEGGDKRKISPERLAEIKSKLESKFGFPLDVGLTYNKDLAYINVATRSEDASFLRGVYENPKGHGTLRPTDELRRRIKTVADFVGEKRNDMHREENVCYVMPNDLESLAE